MYLVVGCAHRHTHIRAGGLRMAGSTLTQGQHLVVVAESPLETDIVQMASGAIVAIARGMGIRA